MVQDPIARPPDQMDMLTCSRAMTECPQNAIPPPEQALKCPRCDSTNTKFCYYNNYSFTQPRHFCKNCRRYWTKGGALRNVPIGGGCRKNKRVKQRAVDPTSLLSLDETTSNMLACINRGNYSSLLNSLSGASSTSFPDLSDQSNRFDLTFSRIQESLRLGEQSGAVPSNPLYGLGIGSNEVTTGLLTSDNSSPPALINNLPCFDANPISLGLPCSTVKPEQGVLFSGSDLCPVFETHTQMTEQSVAAATSSSMLASLEEQISPYRLHTKSDGEHQIRQPQKLILQLVKEGQNIEQGHILPPFEDDTKEYLRPVKGRSIFSFPEFQGMQENYYETQGNSHFWNSNIGWADIQTLAAEGML